MKYGFFLLIAIFIFLVYFINVLTDGYFLDIIYKFPKLIAVAVAVMALVFPRDYHRVPEMLASAVKR